MAESVTYEVLESFEGIEVRRYPAIVIAKVQGLPDNVAFRILFRYLTGENRTRRDIAMTVPVISSGPTYQRISMTRPVLSDEESFSFILPSSVPKAAAPEPLDRRVKLVEISPRKLAVLRFSGRVHSESVKEKEESLLATLRKRGIETKGQVFLMRYNGPGTPGFLRRNEVGVEIMGDMGKG